MQALSVVMNAPEMSDVVYDWVFTGDESLRSAAYSAAYSAAHSAAYYTTTPLPFYPLPTILKYQYPQLIPLPIPSPIPLA
jgi:hypothetical protein